MQVESSYEQWLQSEVRPRIEALKVFRMWEC